MSSGDEEFYRKHAYSFLQASYALVGPHAAEDVFSAAILSVLGTQRWNQLDDEAKRKYLYRTMVNQARRWGRREGKRGQIEAIFSLRDVVGSPTVEMPDATWEVVSSLSVRQRAVVFLTYWEDLDTRTVAETLGISEGSVYKHLDRARKALRRKIDA